ncbi:glycosyltransferase [Hymenobacter radiodurans]|uniref:glycosyltransferase n=1 Tax=Hymenobacter radiodurans TaxID=2496028 RepID=UPI001058A3D0|nr:glycosyltransferase [Hymenobacter radiodurans]
MASSTLPAPKVLHILHSLRFSGAEVMLRLAAPTVHAQGYNQHIIADGATVGDYASTLEDAGFTVYHRPFSKWSISHWWNLYLFLKEKEFTVIHNHTEQNFFWYLLVARLAGIPRLVSTVHSAFNFKGEVRLRRGTYRWIARRLLGTTFTAIGPSVALVEAETYNNPTVLVPNWLDEERFIPARSAAERAEARQHFAISDDTVVLISVGSCTENKNHGAVLEALAALRSKTPYPILYLHVGEGITHLAEQNHAKQLGVDDITRFVGQLHNVRQALLAADVFVMTSFLEGLGNSLLEALSCAVPAVVYDVYGLRDLVIEGKTGRCVPPNVPSLTQALLEMINRPDLRQQYGMAGRNFVQEHYSMQDSLSQLLPLYGTEKVGVPSASKSLDYSVVG